MNYRNRDLKIRIQYFDTNMQNPLRSETTKIRAVLVRDVAFPNKVVIFPFGEHTQYVGSIKYQNSHCIGYKLSEKQQIFMSREFR